MAENGNGYHISTEALLRLLKFKKLSKLRMYVSKYEIFVPIACDPDDRRKHLFDRRCCIIRKKLLDYIKPSDGIVIEKAGKYINEICGKKDKELLRDLDAEMEINDIIARKEKELQNLIENKVHLENGNKKDEKK